jgi:hypothetical protein
MPTSPLATIARVVGLVVILTLVYRGSRAALVVALALGFLAHEITASILARVLPDQIAARVAARLRPTAPVRKADAPRGVEERS